MHSNVRSLVAILLIGAVLVCPTAVLATEAEGTATEGVVAGQADGKANTNSLLWFGAGCVGSWIGVAAAYLVTPSPSATRLLGKSSEYVAAYSDSYRESAKSVQTKNAWTGCVVSACVSGLSYGVYFVVVALAAASY